MMPQFGGGGVGAGHTTNPGDGGGGGGLPGNTFFSGSEPSAIYYSGGAGGSFGGGGAAGGAGWNGSPAASAAGGGGGMMRGPMGTPGGMGFGPAGYSPAFGGMPQQFQPQFQQQQQQFAYQQQYQQQFSQPPSQYTPQPPLQRGDSFSNSQASLQRQNSLSNSQAYGFNPQAQAHLPQVQQRQPMPMAAKDMPLQATSFQPIHQPHQSQSQRPFQATGPPPSRQDAAAIAANSWRQMDDSDAIAKAHGIRFSTTYSDLEGQMPIVANPTFEEMSDYSDEPSGYVTSPKAVQRMPEIHAEPVGQLREKEPEPKISHEARKIAEELFEKSFEFSPQFDLPSFDANGGLGDDPSIPAPKPRARPTKGTAANVADHFKDGASVPSPRVDDAMQPLQGATEPEPDRWAGYSMPGEISSTIEERKKMSSRGPSATPDIERQTGPDPSLDVTNVIFSGFLLKKNRRNQFQKRLFRFDGVLLICLSPKRQRLPEHINLLTFDPARHQNSAMSQEFASALTRFYPTDPPMPALTNPLIASYEGENEPDHYGNPDIYTKYYHMPKWIISSSMVVSVRSLAQNPLQDPESKLSRTFVIETQHREYILRAPTAAEFRRWTFLLSRMSAHGGDRPMHLDDRHLQDPSFLLQTEDDEEVINDQPDADDDDMFDFPDQKQLAGVYESQVQEEQSLEQKHSSLARMGAWRRSVADLIQSDVEARNSVLSVTNTSEGKATVERGLGSHSLASNNGPGPQASQGHSQFEHQQPYQPGLPFDAGPRPLPPGRMPVPIKPGELKAPDGRIMRGPTIFGAAIAAGVHPTTMILPGAPNMQPARDDSAMMPLQPPGQGQGSREVSPYGVKLSEDQPREAAPEVNEPPPAGPLPPPLPAFKLQANDFKDFFGADDDDEDDEPKPSSQKQEPPKKGGFKFPFTGGHRRSLSKRKKENRMSILSESGQAIPAVYQPKQTRKSGLSRSDPPAPQLQRKNTLTRSDSTGMQQNSFPMPTGSSQGLLQTFADMNLGPAQGNQKIPPGVFPPGALPPQMQNQAPPGFPPFPQQAGMNFPNAIPLPAPLPHFPPHAAKQKLPPFDPSTIEDVIHASNGISRVIRRLQGQDRDADGTDQTRKPVFPSDDHIAHFVAISIPHLIGRILRAIDERVGQLQDAGITGIGTGFPEMRRDLVGCGEEWEVRVVRSIMSAPPSVGAKRMLWTRIFEDVGSNVAPLCGRLVAVSGSARSLFA